MSQEFDVVILGAGSAGYACALRAAQLGLSVALVDEGPVGGTCLHRGCIPTKSWLQAAKVRQSVISASAFGIGATLGDVDAAAVLGYATGVVGQLHKGLQGLIASRGIKLVNARGSLVTDQRGPGIDVDGSVLRARAVVIATGAEPITLGLAVDGTRILTSWDALQRSTLPERAIVLGGGVIGVEFASMWADLGVAVTLVEATPSLLPTEEPDLAKVLQAALVKRGVDVLLSCPITAAHATDSGVRVELGGDTLEADVLLVAAGRRPMLEGIGLDEAGVKRAGAHISVDSSLRTSVKGVYAAGDVVRGPQLAHRGYAHGLFLAEHIAHTQGKHSSRTTLCADSDIARITYSHPQVASVGLTTTQAEAEGPVEVADYPLRGNGRALMSRPPGERETGLVRVIRRSGGEILGVHAVGDDVAELIAEGALLVGWGATPEDLRDIVHPHPTLSEALAEANLKLAGSPLHMHS
ncbi:dihydrolipoyl dehydrogenase [Tessaracoccus antarcticus]|uniref:Dihydrolipoyl dehydrogenase n=1 Tax=Tessaracoccus antarcticus TaxID=2479848 RepID=A0A3M0GAW8_9ACTN|nr:dihydrolipoyl dehydrogenase [Tessaracoccus antarcticus]RMB59632.1 dihydrolipoyl dehydrogenase [Tessaracoccus antarcticus]